jgi:hypothetical protein
VKVKYLGASEAQDKFGGCDKSREILRIGDTYEVSEQEIHKWHTSFTLKGYEGYRFNSVCFKEIK